jgi:membrane dipeptidase
VTARFQPSQQSVCEGTRKTLDILAQWYQWFDRHSDLIMPVRQTPDIAAAKASRRTGIILGFQNASPIEVGSTT